MSKSIEFKNITSNFVNLDNIIKTNELYRKYIDKKHLKYSLYFKLDNNKKLDIYTNSKINNYSFVKPIIFNDPTNDDLRLEKKKIQGNISNLLICRTNQEKKIIVCQYPTVVLMGDSTIDNIVWVDNETETVYSQLKKLYRENKKNRTIYNCAIDGNTSKGLLDTFPTSISRSQRQSSNADKIPFLNGNANFEEDAYNTLAAINHINKKILSPTHVIISVGGNDVRAILGNPLALPITLITFFKNYYKIIKNIREINKTIKIIIMTQYITYTKWDGYGILNFFQNLENVTGSNVGVYNCAELMNFIYFILIKYLVFPFNCDVINLSDSFDYTKKQLYKSEIEPSNYGSTIISYLMYKIIEIKETYHSFTPVMGKLKNKTESKIDGNFVMPPFEDKTKIKVDDLDKYFEEEVDNDVSAWFSNNKNWKKKNYDLKDYLVIPQDQVDLYKGHVNLNKPPTPPVFLS